MLNLSSIRNFSVIAHINHGKSTLADRFLELTKTVPVEKMKPQYLDQMGLERERGITIKMQPVRMAYHLRQSANSKKQSEDDSRFALGDLPDSEYILNLIDTPGHVDFSYEVSRALAAVEGTVLLVDAQKGVQAQTLSHLRAAQELGLKIIPAVNKIDLPQARTQEVKQEIAALLNIDSEQVLGVSAKTGQGVEELLNLVIEKISPPNESTEGTRALVFDSFYDPYKGVLAHVRFFGGTIKSGDKIFFIKSGRKTDVLETGIFSPQLTPTKELTAGEIGYIATGLKETGIVKVGDTITLAVESDKTKALSGYQEPQPVVFASFYPIDSDQLDLLRSALGKLKLNDAALTYEPESSTVLGRGFKLGFLGLLHLEIVAERLRREFNLNLTTSTPSVEYLVEPKGGQVLKIQNAALVPPEYETIKEPWAFLEIVTPIGYLNPISQLILKHRGLLGETKTLSQGYLLLQAEAPLAEIITGFYDQLKSITSGFASLNWRLIDYRKGDLVKLEILVASEKVEGLTRIVPRANAYNEGKRTVEKLKELLPAQQFAVSLQASAQGRIIARETMRAMRKDVTGYLYGGDRTRKDKLLKKQKQGKKRLQETGRVRIPAKVYLEILKP